MVKGLEIWTNGEAFERSKKGGDDLGRFNTYRKEILAKTRSLKGILEPFTTKENLNFLKRAGFKDYVSIQKYLCFEGFLAIK